MFDQTRHFTPVYRDWDEAEVRAAIREIADDALAAGSSENLWPAHPMDEDTPDGTGCVYLGGAGVVWALDALRRRGFAGEMPDFAPFLDTALANNASWTAEGPYPEHGSLLMGDLGILLVRLRVTPGESLPDRIFDEAAKNNSLPVRELMWGLPGSMLACVHAQRLTGQTRFEKLFREQAALLLADMTEDDGVPIWIQDLYDHQLRFLGPVHGFAGNMIPLLLGWDLLSAAQREIVADAVPRTQAAYALQAPEGANWRPVVLSDVRNDRPPLCQHCHGAPGMVTSFAAAPFSTPSFEALLAAGGDFAFFAGPLAKGSNLCHGTGGNGYAFLKLFVRTGDRKWLDRARTFAMVAIDQCRTARVELGRGRYSLWTGDVGLAVYLADCIDGTAAFPSVDVV